MLENPGLQHGQTAGSGEDSLIVPVHSKGLLLDRLIHAIRSGRLKPGERLMTEREIAIGSGLARSTVRDVLGELERAGLIRRNVGRGTFIAETGEAASPAAARYAPAALIEFRQNFEPHLAELIVFKASEAELAELQRYALDGRRVKDWRACEEVDQAFHGKLYEIAHNAVISALGAELTLARTQPGWLRIKELNFAMESWVRFQSEHEAIAEALALRDAAQGRDLLKRHLLDVRAGWVL